MSDDDILDINSDDLDDEPLPPVTPDIAATLDLSLNDLAEESAAADAFPALTADQLVAATNSITIRTLCSATGQAFTVRYVEDKPGLFVTHEVTTGDAAPGAAAPGATGEVQGSFGTSPDYACPYCGSQAILVCGKCGADICVGPAGGKGRGVTCPNCKAHIAGTGGPATTATGLLGKSKGK